jgi:ATP-binding cassette subfamily B protein
MNPAGRSLRGRFGRFGRAGVWADYIALFAGHRRRLGAAGLVYVVKHSPAVLLPVITGLVVDALSQRQPVSALLLLALCGSVLIALNLPGHVLFVRWLSQALRDVERQLRQRLARRAQQLAIDSAPARNPAVLQSKLVRDVEAVEMMTRVLADGVLGGGSAIVVALAVTALRAPEFLLLFLLTVPLAAGLIVHSNRRLAWRNARFRRSVERMQGSVQEMTRLVPMTRAHALEEQALRRVDASFRRVQRIGRGLDDANGLFNGLSWVSFQALSLTCLMVAAWVRQSGLLGITLGDVVLLSGFFVSLTGAVVGLTSLIPTVSRGLEAVRSIGQVLQDDDIEHNEGKTRVSAVRGAIELQRVHFRFPSGPADALQGISLQVQPGQTVALVGPSGSGKSTLLNLVIGLRRPTAGRILLDGVDAATLDLRSWREHIAVVPQDCVLLDASIHDNVAFGMAGLPRERIAQALHDACCSEFVDALPKGMDTLLGPQGTQLSGGQRQRLAVARAFARHAHVLFLDEATSALDAHSEALLHQALQRLRQGCTTFIIAHRLQTVRDAERIVVLDAGRVVDVGSHAELQGRCALYRALVAHDGLPPTG